MLGSGYLRRTDSALEVERLPVARQSYHPELREDAVEVEQSPVDVSTCRKDR
jgi:hypothetical protein